VLLTTLILGYVLFYGGSRTMQFDRQGLEVDGFIGFHTIEELRRVKLSIVPPSPGV
jgi:hypothetical protein